MDVQDIELIHAIAETGTISQACNELNMSQPTLSKRLARLEHVLDAQLFHRYPRGLAPTEVANYILSKADPLRHQISEIERHVEMMTQLEAGKLKLGVGPIIEQILLPDLLLEFINTTGSVQLTILTEDESTLLSMLDASELDVIVGPFDADAMERDDRLVMPMISDSIISVARPDHPIFAVKNYNGSNLLDYPWVAPITQGTVEETASSPVIELMKIRSENYGMLKRLTSSTDVICAGPRAVFRQEFEAGTLREIKTDLGLTWKSALITRPETFATPLARHLVGMFESAAKRLNTQNS